MRERGGRRGEHRSHHRGSGERERSAEGREGEWIGKGSGCSTAGRLAEEEGAEDSARKQTAVASGGSGRAGEDAVEWSWWCR